MRNMLASRKTFCLNYTNHTYNSYHTTNNYRRKYTHILSESKAIKKCTLAKPAKINEVGQKVALVQSVSQQLILKQKKEKNEMFRLRSQSVKLLAHNLT